MNRIFLLFAVAVCLGSFGSFVSAKFPDDPKPCKYDDSDCITNIVNFLMQQKAQGYSSLNLISIDPLKVSKISIKQGAESPVNIDLVFSNSEIFGLSHSTTTKVKGFGKDIKQKKEVHMKLDVISLVSDYSISGKVLILPISGTGKSNITLENTNMVLHFSGIPKEKDGATYMDIKNMRISWEPQRIYYDFSNLFNGDKALGENMNLFLNENWKDIFHEVEGSISEAFSKIFGSIINNVFQKYPYDKYFIEE